MPNKCEKCLTSTTWMLEGKAGDKLWNKSCEPQWVPIGKGTGHQGVTLVVWTTNVFAWLR